MSSAGKKSLKRPLSYGLGALITLVFSVGIATVVYGAGLIPFDPFNIPAWIFGLLGAYTVVYAFRTHRDPLYYAVWGSVMLAVTAASALYSVVNVFVVAGALLIVLAFISLLAHWRRRR